MTLLAGLFGLLISSVAVVSALAADDARLTPRPQLQALNTLVNYLELDAAQRQSLLAQRAAHTREWQPLTARAQMLASAAATPARQPDNSAALAQLCQQAQELQNSQRAQLRQLLNARQRDKMLLLDEAFALMPMVEAAQAAGLMGDHLDLPPPGFPSGTVTVATSWRRMPAAALPGCSATRVLREVELKGAGERKVPPPPPQQR